MTDDKQPEELGVPEEQQPASDGDDTTLLCEQLEEALREKDQFRAMAQRAQADLANYKHRSAEERAELRRTANSQLLLKAIAFGDDLDRALSLIPPDAVAAGWLEGLQLVRRNLIHMLESEGVTKIDAEGQPFEPWEHEAVSYEESPGDEEGIVLRVVRDGYKLHDKVLRPAQVAVSKETQPQSQQDTTTEEA
jgi:molecular chaperone GrpE (heat shock protein)